MKIRIKKLSTNAVIPTYSKPGDAGLDLTATEVFSCADYIEYKTGLAFEIPEGYVGLIFPRSSVTKYGLMCKNSVAVIDSGYRGEVTIRFQAMPTSLRSDKFYNTGDRVGQLIVLPYPTVEFEEVEELSETERGNGGYGSTGS